MRDVVTATETPAIAETVADAICRAIRSRRPIEFLYCGGYRLAEPFCLGLVVSPRAASESLLCYQTGGSAELGEAAGWKLYRVNDIEEIWVTEKEFTEGRRGVDGKNIRWAKVRCSAFTADDKCYSKR